MLVPNSVFQLAALLLLVVPGIVFAAVRRRLIGPVPDDKDFSVRLIRAISVSVLLDVLYIIALGPFLLDLRQRPAQPGSRMAGFAAAPRESALLGLLLLIVIPAALALASHVRLRRARWPFTLLPVYQPTPTAWDQAAPNRGPCFVRVFTGDGYFVGGWMDGNSYVSTYPEARDIFISVEWRLGDDGRFIEPVKDSIGLFVPLNGSERVAWVWHPGT